MRWPTQAAIIALGAVVAVSTIGRTTYLPKTSLVAKLSEGDAAARDRMNSLLSATSSASAATVATTSSARKTDLGVNVAHARVDFWVNRLSTTMADGFATELGKMAKYADMITSKLAAKQMPKDLIYLAMIESGFNPNARSKVQAVGMWQFMKPTAKQYGLAVGKKVDERKDPARATDAALKYLDGLHDRLGSWYLAAAAYNSGEGTVTKALKKITGKSTGTDEDFFKIMPVLPKETQDYVPKLIASAQIGNAPEQYGISPTNAPAVAESKATKTAKPTAVKLKKKTATVQRPSRSHTTVRARSARKTVKR